MKRCLNTILATDKEIVEHSELYTKIYGSVTQFVDKYNIRDRKIGSQVHYWVIVGCTDPTLQTSDLGYYFTTIMSHRIVEDITAAIVREFVSKSSILLNSECTLTVDKGL